jgi:hypothetical protein
MPTGTHVLHVPSDTNEQGRMIATYRIELLRTVASIALVLAIAGNGHAQNLVNNPSFEEYTTCPNDISQFDRVVGWQTIANSPDYFNTCADDTVSVPYNAVGYQWPSDGEAYAGVVNAEFGKEYFQAELSSPVVLGQLTYVSMRLAAGGFGYPFWSSPMLAGNNVGMHLSTTPWAPLTFNTEFEVNSAAVHMADVLSDTTSWIVLSAAFIADSAYRYVQIGNFFSDSLCTYSVLDSVPGGTGLAYAFVDLVCVSQQAGVCDTDIGVVQVPGVANPAQALLFSDVLTIPLSAWGYGKEATQVELVDGTGRLVAAKHIPALSTAPTWDLSGVASGPYYLRISSIGLPSFTARSWKIEP